MRPMPITPLMSWIKSADFTEINSILDVQLRKIHGRHFKFLGHSYLSKVYFSRLTHFSLLGGLFVLFRRTFFPSKINEAHVTNAFYVLDKFCRFYRDIQYIGYSIKKNP